MLVFVVFGLEGLSP